MICAFFSPSFPFPLLPFPSRSIKLRENRRYRNRGLPLPFFLPPSFCFSFFSIFLLFVSARKWEKISCVLGALLPPFLLFSPLPLSGFVTRVLMSSRSQVFFPPFFFFVVSSFVSSVFVPANVKQHSPAAGPPFPLFSFFSFFPSFEGHVVGVNRQTASDKTATFSLPPLFLPFSPFLPFLSAPPF